MPSAISNTSREAISISELRSIKNELIILPLINILLGILLPILPNKNPSASFFNKYSVEFTLVLINIICYIMLFIPYKNINNINNLINVFWTSLCLLLVLIGNYLPKSIGLATKNHSESSNSVARKLGYLMVAMSLALLISLYFNPYTTIIILGVFVVLIWSVLLPNFRSLRK